MSAAPATAAPSKPPAPRLGAVDGLRALAMLMVYFYHTWQFSGSPALAQGGWSLGRLIDSFPSGVDLFMVLSGFCLFWPIAKRPDQVHDWSARDFALRRVRRIVPPYYAAIVLVTLLPIVLVLLYRSLGQPAKWQPIPGAGQYLSHFLFVHTLFPTTWDGLQGVFWSLGLEAQFYLVFPLVVVAFRRWGLAAIAGMIVVSVLYRLGTLYYFAGRSWDVQFVASIFFLGRWMQFAAGMLAAWVVARGLRAGWRGPLGGTALLAVAAVFYGLAQDSAGTFSPARDLLLAASFGLGLIAFGATETPLRRLVENRALQWVGLISYSVFLIHQNLVYYFAELLKKVLHLQGAASFAVLATFGLAFILAVAAVFFRCFERPFLAAPRPRSEGPAPALGQVLPQIV